MIKGMFTLMGMHNEQRLKQWEQNKRDIKHLFLNSCKIGNVWEFFSMIINDAEWLNSCRCRWIKIFILFHIEPRYCTSFTIIYTTVPIWPYSHIPNTHGHTYKIILGPVLCGNQQTYSQVQIKL